MAKTSTKSVAIAQVLTQDQSTEFIILFLKKTFKNLRPPGEIVCNEGKALLKALVGTFANFENIKRRKLLQVIKNGNYWTQNAKSRRLFRTTH